MVRLWLSLMLEPHIVSTRVTSIVRSLALVRPCFGLSYSPHVPSFHISYYSLTITLVSAPTSCFTLSVPMREVYCVRYTPRAWDSRSLLSILDVPLYFRLVVMNP